MSSTIGNKIKVSIFGESHAKCIGCVLDGLPAGESIDVSEILGDLKKRAPQNADISTSRKEDDNFNIICGMMDNRTTGSPLCAIIKNKDVKSGDYDSINDIMRPGHADFTGFVKYNGFNDARGGGHFSGRLTAAFVFAGSVCRQILKRQGISIVSHISSIGSIKDNAFPLIDIPDDMEEGLSCEKFPLINKNVYDAMIEEIKEAKAEGDSVGGTVECAVRGLPIGLGNPIFDGVESVISHYIFSIPAVKGIEFGSGFNGTSRKGSENNDPFVVKDGKVSTVTNNHGGILGGISSGMPIIFKIAVKPTPSIAKKQYTINKSLKNTELEIFGRHDPCIVPRIPVIVESVTALAVLEMLLNN